MGLASRSGSGQERPWQPVEGARWRSLAVPEKGETGFTLLASAATGVGFTNELGELSAAANRVLDNGAGVAAGDYDDDGLPDLFWCSLQGPSRLYRNLGHWRFEEVTAAAGLVLTNRLIHGAVFADLNGDGHLDLLLATIGEGVLCFLNDGHGKFTDFTASAGTRTGWGSFTLALADVDGNGTLDLYVANYRTDDIRDRGRVDLRAVGGKLVIPPALKDRLTVVNGRVLEYGEPDILYLNDGHGRFTPVPWTGGAFLDEAGKPLAGPPLDWGLTAAFRDLNGDGFPDLYVCNDFWTPDRIWINDGHGRFRAIANTSIRHVPASSMGVDFADVDHDGHPDIFALDMLSRDHRLRKRQLLAEMLVPSPIGDVEQRAQVMRNVLLRNRGDGTFEDLADFSGVAASDWSWTPVFIDVDLDGNEDILIPSGHAHDVQDLDANERIMTLQHPWNVTNGLVQFQGKTLPFQQAFSLERMLNIRLYPRLEMPIVAFRNEGAWHFREQTAAWGLATPGIHNAIALADFDGDGGLDFVVNNLNAAAGIYRHHAGAARVAVRLRGQPPNTQGIGARVRLLGGAIPLQSREVFCGGRFLSGSDPLLVFAAGTAPGGMTIEVDWRSSRHTRIRDVGPNRLYEIEEPAAPAGPIAGDPPATPSVSPPLFEDVSDRLNHQHVENLFNDFERQPLLPQQLSRSGPGIAWFDVDGDGVEDLVIASGKGGPLSLYRGDARGGFEAMRILAFTEPAPRDQTTPLGWLGPGGSPTILVGSANYEDGLDTGAGVRQYLPGQKSIDDGFPGTRSSTGPLALGDMLGDGHLVLFVGGQVIPGRYPEPASSTLFRFDGARWRLDAPNSQVLDKVGLVNGAVWTDLDGDGFPELVLACQWGPVRVFGNDGGRLRETTDKWGLSPYTGWWTGIASGDFDGDGRLDLVVGNWGLNSPFQASPEQPLRLYYGDWADRGALDLLETEYDPATRALVPRRGLRALLPALPSLREAYPTHQAFSETTAGDFLRRVARPAAEAQAATLRSTLFLNRGDRFEAVPLPSEAQFSPAFAVAIADFDGDGREDVFLSQNFFAVRPDLPRLDAGRGLLLLGQGNDSFKALPGQASGIAIYGEQRGAAVADFDQDGRPDLAVTQNGAATRLLHNTGGRPGLRVRLLGPPGNPQGVGAVLRLIFGEQPGPTREIHAGSGYWSQDSALPVLATPETPSKLWIRWPGGRTTLTDLPSAAREVTVRADGTLADALRR